MMYSFCGGPLDGETREFDHEIQEVLLGEIDAEDTVFYWLEEGVYQFKGKRTWPGREAVTT